MSNNETPRKPGYKTSEFWLSLICIVIGALIAGDFVGAESMGGKVLAFAASAFTALGYSVSRGIVKKAETLTEAIEANKKDPS
jgi:drug/metabolite transporter (DMT)-like permease